MRLKNRLRKRQKTAWQPHLPVSESHPASFRGEIIWSSLELDETEVLAVTEGSIRKEWAKKRDYG
jgi:hypothetical protein